MRHVGLCSNLLGNWQQTYRVEGAPEPKPGQWPHTECNAITPDHLNAMGIRLLAGRPFTIHDNANSTPVILVDERFVQRWWPEENPLGKHVHLNGGKHEIIGVVNHVRPYGIDQDSREAVYFSAFQDTVDAPSLVVRCQGDPWALVEPLRRAITSIDPELAPSNIQTLQSIRSEQSFMRRFLTILLGLFAVAALLLAALGLYGVTAYAVGQRTQEFGVRMALGACVQDILALVMGRGGMLAGIGITLGLVASIGLSYFLSGLLYGVTAWDPVTFFAVTAVLGIVVGIACYLPARSATRVDPMEALRYE